MQKEKTIIYLDPKVKQDLQIQAILDKKTMTKLAAEFIEEGLKAKVS